MKSFLQTVFFFLSFLFLVSCEPDYVPKPRGYLRIDMPTKAYKTYDSTCPFRFDYPVYTNIKPFSDNTSQKCWLNIDFPTFKGKLHLSYFALNNDLTKYTEDARTFVYKHIVKADAIDEMRIKKNEEKVYGILYYIGGNAASSIQFYLTDSTKHFVRAALYFNTIPNRDSLAPVIDFIGKDIEKMIQTFSWK